jgi:hypothetical protein
MPSLNLSCSLMSIRSRRQTLGVLAAVGMSFGFAGSALAQDSVSIVPGGNDSLSSFDSAVQRTRFVVDLTPATTSWNNAILVAPIIKASRDTDPMFRTQILGAVAVSPNLATGLSFASLNYSTWTSAGAGVSPTQNSAPGSIAATGFASQFGVAISDFSLAPSSVVGATVGRVSGQFNRLFVDRVVAASSRSVFSGADTATLSLGGVDALGNLAVRADNFNTLPATTTRVLGDNIARVSLSARGSSVNTLRSSAGSNTSDDTAATTYIISNELTPTNTPTIVNQAGIGAFALAYDFAGRFRAGLNSGSLSTTGTHIPASVSGHRGNPAFSTTTTAGGPAGTVASIAMPLAGTRANTLMMFGLNFGFAGSAPTPAPGTARAFSLPIPISVPGFSANTGGAAAFNQYLSQTPWRGGNGQVGIGQDAANNAVLAATATDPTQGEFIAVAKVPQGGPAAWTIAAFQGMPVLSGAGGSSIGTLSTTNLKLSAPGVDRLGNIYFVGTWKPTLTPAETAVFKSVNTGTGYQLELVIRTGQQIVGANSTRTYTISSLTLTDSDSIASGSMFSQSVIQQQAPGATTSNAQLMRAFGGLVVSAVITYDNAGSSEAYDALLYVGPAAGTDCLADFNGQNGVSVQDIFDFLTAWFAGAPSADINGTNGVTVQDIFDFLSLWFAGC